MAERDAGGIDAGWRERWVRWPEPGRLFVPLHEFCQPPLAPLRALWRRREAASNSDVTRPAPSNRPDRIAVRLYAVFGPRERPPWLPPRDGTDDATADTTPVADATADDAAADDATADTTTVDDAPDAATERWPPRTPRYLSTVPRLALRHTPAVVGSLTAILYVSVLLRADLSAVTDGRAAGGVTGSAPWLLAAVGLLSAAGLALAFYRAEECSPRTFVSRAADLVLFYATLGALLVGTGVEVARSMGWLTVDAVPRDALDASGYLLLLFLGGLLVYDGMLRYEHLFADLSEMVAVVGADAPRFERRFADALARRWPGGDDGGGGVPVVLLAAGAFAAGPAVLWTARTLGAANGGVPWVRLVSIPWLPNVVLVAVAFQFIVTIRYIHRLVVADDYRIRYYPSHPDGRGGLEGLGDLAARVNVILVLGGLYLAYRIVAGSGGAKQTALVVTLLAAATYTVTVVAWLYYSFWTLHRTMRRERRRWIANGGEPPPDYGHADWRRDDRPSVADVEDAPVWPVSTSRLTGQLVANAAPVALLFFQRGLV